MTRIPLAATFVVLLVAIACSGGSPTSPSANGGATITGTVVAASSPTTGVAVAGTSITSAIDTSSGNFRLGGVPAGDVQLVFTGSGPTSSVALSSVADREVIDLRVAISGGTARVESEVRGNGAGKLVMCHREDSGGYHAIDISGNAEAAHRGHGDARPGEPVPGDSSKVFDESCRAVSPVRIEKFTNGEDANNAPGPTIAIGGPVNWTYVVTNRSPLTFTSLSVTDDRGVAVACPKMIPAPGASITCTGSGKAVAGQYRNVGTVTVTADGRQYMDSDASHYFGGDNNGEGEEGPKVQLCHRTGNGQYHMISVSINAEPAHRAHGDGMVGEAVPGATGRVFTASCGVQ